MLHIEDNARGRRFAPLTRITVTGTGAGTTLVVRDARGREYLRKAAGDKVSFLTGGAQGVQTVALLDAAGETVEQAELHVEARTRIQDAGGTFDELLTVLYHSMLGFNETDHALWNGRIFHFFVCWVRDHVHALKGMKYFHPQLRDGIDLYHLSQREDGMIWDNCHPRPGGKRSMWDERFEYGDFIRPFEDGSREFKRIPAENDVEYLYVEGIYYTWKAVDDDAWMLDKLESAMRALDYTLSSPYRWSDKYNLLKRAYTIDTWDFQNHQDACISNDACDPMVVKLGRTHFGIFYGDNTGYAMSCGLLAEMLEHVGRAEEAARYRQRGREIQQRLDELSWNGSFYTHHVREDENVDVDLGKVPEEKRLSLSNAYSLNRGIDHDKCVAIIKSYQKLRKNLPEGSPGEWYTMYPPYEKGFGRHNQPWQYMNASVTPIVAGELAHGAFEHGFEEYGADVLRRVLGLAKSTDNHLHCSYVGAFPKRPKATYAPLDIRAEANTDFAGSENADRPDSVPGWTGEGDNDLHEMPTGKQKLAGVPWQVPDPESNGRRGCIGVSVEPAYTPHVEVQVNRTAASVYLLHTSSRGKDGVAGTLTFDYADGTKHVQTILIGSHVSGWWMPSGHGAGPGRNESPTSVVAWEGKNARCRRVGVVASGLDNPHPKKTIRRLTLDAHPAGGLWLVAGITLSDQPYRLGDKRVSFGIPDNWGAAAVVYALIEGLAGVVDRGTGYRTAEVAPRWTAAGVKKAKATVTYPASDGYVAYQYQHSPKKRQIKLRLTGSGDAARCHILLPGEARKLEAVTVGRNEIPADLVKVEKSRYADFELPGVAAPAEVTVTYA